MALLQSEANLATFHEGLFTMALLYSFSPCKPWALLNRALVFDWFSSRTWGERTDNKKVS